jgi:alginate O-acetyltransferase complex protein AlgI
LLLSSCYFYMAFVPIYIVILGFTIVIDFFAGLGIEKLEGRKRKALLIISIVSNISVLMVFKYYNFFLDNIRILSEPLGGNLPYLNILLPIGLSFHTFQAMSYTIEVYRGNQKAEKNFGIYSLYVMFYPQLVAGPIERPQNMLHQFREKHIFEYKNVTFGLKLMVWGLIKKVVIADRLAVIVNQVYNHPQSYEGIPLLIATLFFTFQIYCDFSGYSDIAIGSAQVMGFTFMKNFDSPYRSKSISEFWRRWHISLSTWFRDYVYIPLGGNRVAIPVWYFNLFLIFLISGLWHGASWTYVIWGGLHGFYIVFALITQKARHRISALIGLDNFPKIKSAAQIFVTFILVWFAWIFFRANTLSDAIYIVTHLTKGIPDIFNEWKSIQILVMDLFIEYKELILSFFFIGIIILSEFLPFPEWHGRLMNKPAWVRMGVYYAMVILILQFGVFGEKQFIYFQF